MTYRATLVGCGGISRAWIRTLEKIDEVELVGFADLREEAARARAEEAGHPDAVVGGDFRDVIDRTKPDVVLDCTVPAAHRDVTLAALERGCHVLGEKPLSDSMESAREMVEAARRAGRRYAVANQRRFNPQAARLRDFVRSGAIGPLTTVNCDFYLGAHFGGFRAEMEHVLLVDMAIHTFDAARFLTGADPVAVYCHEWNPAGSWFRHGASAMAIFEMTGGLVFNYRGSWCSEGLNTPWEAEWRLVGESGTATWDGAGDQRAQAFDSPTDKIYAKMKDLEVPPPPNPGAEERESLFRNFFGCLASDDAPETRCEDNIKSLAMVLAAVESAETGQRVPVEA